VSFERNRESRSREAAGRRNWPEAVPTKMCGRKKVTPIELSANERGRAGQPRGKLGQVRNQLCSGGNYDFHTMCWRAVAPEKNCAKRSPLSQFVEVKAFFLWKENAEC
jgi:hypothetical protein